MDKTIINLPHIKNKKSVRRWLLFSFIVVSVFSFSFFDTFRNFDLFILDHQVSLLRQKNEPLKLDKDVIIVGIDENTVESFPEPMALWHQHFADFLLGIKELQPQVIGFDFILPTKSYDFLIPGLDRQLLKAFLQVKNDLPIVLGNAPNIDGRTENISPILLSMLGNNSSGMVLWEKDTDGLVRSFNRIKLKNDKELPSLLSAMLNKMGTPPQYGMINYSMGEPFSYYPMHSLLKDFRQGDFEKYREAFKNKPVLFGVVFKDVDRHILPVKLTGWEDNFHSQPGILIHAQALRSILNDKIIQEIQPINLIIIGLAISVLWFFIHSVKTGIIFLITLSPSILFVSHLAMKENVFLPAITILAFIITTIALRLADILTDYHAERNKLKSAFQGAVSPTVLSQIMQDGLPENMQRDACILFTDIRGYTSISENMTPKQIMGFLNDYYNISIPVIHKHSGTLFSIMGDGLYAIFGVPNNLTNPCQAAFDAAQEMLATLDKYNQELKQKGQNPLAIGFGLHYGHVIAGNVGSEERSDYTAVGDAVNTTARLESMTKKYGYKILCSKEVINRIHSPVTVTNLGDIEIRGRSNLHIFGLHPTDFN